MDQRLRELERRALESGSEADLHAFLTAAYRVGYYVVPKRKDIQTILRRQAKRYTQRGMRILPRYYKPDDPDRALNISDLQHPEHVSEWGGDYGDWREALRDAMPGDLFEANTYHRIGNQWEGYDWNLSDVISLEVPSESYYWNNKYYGPPPDFRAYKKRYRRNADATLRELLRKYHATRDKNILRQYIAALARAGLTDPTNLKEYVWALDQAGDIEDHTGEITTSIANAFFRDRWMSELEERNISLADVQTPRTPPDATLFAQQYINKLEVETKLSINAFFEFITSLPRDQYFTEELTPSHFGYLVAMSALGHGVGLWEAVPSNLKEFVKVPMAPPYMIAVMCDICGDIPEGNIAFHACNNENCLSGIIIHGERHPASICNQCLDDCENCSGIYCPDCLGDHPCV